MKAAIKDGTLETLIDAGAVIDHPSCGSCFGGRTGTLADGEVCISASSRNFPGRMGSSTAKIYLANPYVVAVSAIVGEIADPRDL